MSFARLTLQQLIDRIAADIEARLPGADARTRRSNLAVLARTQAGAVNGLYGYLDWIARQALPDTAEAEILDRHASLHNVTRTTAVAATGNITFTGSNGVVIPSGTELQRSDGALYTTGADATIASGTATAAVTAQTLGATGNADVGIVLTLISPISGVTSTATVASGALVGGTDQESDADLLVRLMERIQTPPQGGSAADYVAWAKEVAGVTRAWCFPLEGGAGTVTVRFVRDDDASIIPDAGEIAAVQAHLNEVRPVTAAVTVAAPTAVPRDFTIALTPNTQAVKDAVTAELSDLIRREAYPGATMLLSHIREAISIAADETNHVLTVPSADVTYTNSQIGTMGTITWA
jgi:uncharacterized phage protein gp47/JayE